MQGYLLRDTSAVKSVQRGVVQIPASAVEIEIPINGINPDKSIVLLEGDSYAGGTSSYRAYVASITQHSLVIRTQVKISSLGNPISWQIIEFV